VSKGMKAGGSRENIMHGACSRGDKPVLVRRGDVELMIRSVK
jgi:hypothetical protein